MKVTAAHLKSEAEKWGWAELLGVWEKIKQKEEIPFGGPGKAFEYLVVRAFQLDGVRVCWPFEVTYPQRFGTMEQIDGVVYWGERSFLLESKDFSLPADIEPVAKLRFRLEGRPPGTMGILFSARGFSQPAEVFTQFAAPLNVILWSGNDLEVALKSRSMRSGLRQKLEYATEHGLPLFPLEDEG